jgi:hypothetical protein
MRTTTLLFALLVLGCSEHLTIGHCPDAGCEDSGPPQDAGTDAAPDARSPTCGNGAVEAGEECDDGAENSDTRAGACRTSCTNAGCGDGVIDAEEDCDGARLGDATCTDVALGTVGELACAADCSYDTSSCSLCGNGVRDAGEACEGSDVGAASCADEGRDGGVACTPACTLDFGACFICGDGSVDGPEQCDGAELGGATCALRGLSGELGCSDECTFDDSTCTGACAPADWAIEIVDTGSVYVYPPRALALDAAGRAHVIYFDADHFDLRHAERAGAGEWSTRVVDSPGATGLYATLALDRSGGLHAAYQAEPGDTSLLRYAHRPLAGSFTTSTVFDGGAGYIPSIAVDALDTVHIGWLNNSRELHYSRRASGGEWIDESVDEIDNADDGWSMALDSAGVVHVSYYVGIELGMRYARRSAAGVWEFEVADASASGVGLGSGSEIAVDADGGVHIAYRDAGAGDLRYAHRDAGGTWTIDMVDGDGDTGQDASIAIDAANGVHIAYSDFTSHDQRYAYRPAGGVWSTETIDTPGRASGRASIAVDAWGGVHIAYTFAHEGSFVDVDLRHAYRRICP